MCPQSKVTNSQENEVTWKKTHVSTSWGKKKKVKTYSCLNLQWEYLKTHYKMYCSNTFYPDTNNNYTRCIWELFLVKVIVLRPLFVMANVIFLLVCYTKENYYIQQKEKLKNICFEFFSFLFDAQYSLCTIIFILLIVY